MRIAIIGPGALGCLFAAKLQSSTNEQDEILLIDHREERAEQLNKQKILLESGTDSNRYPVTVSSSPTALAPVDILLCCVKSYQLPSSLEFIAPLLTPRALLVFFQNGISHLKYSEQNTFGATVAYAATSEGATRLASGHIRHAGTGHTSLGYLSPAADSDNRQLQRLQQKLEAAGFASSISDNIAEKLWEKLFVNVGINGLTAMYNRTNGQLLTSCAARGKLKKLVREAESVAHAIGMRQENDPVLATLAVCKRTARNISSMLQDIRNKRPTEIDAINGAISRLGRANGIPTPVNDELIAQIKKIEAQYQ